MRDLLEEDHRMMIAQLCFHLQAADCTCSSIHQIVHHILSFQKLAAAKKFLHNLPSDSFQLALMRLVYRYSKSLDNGSTRRKIKKSSKTISFFFFRGDLMRFTYFKKIKKLTSRITLIFCAFSRIFLNF